LWSTEDGQMLFLYWRQFPADPGERVCCVCVCVPALHQLRADPLPVSCVVLVQGDQVPELGLQLPQQQQAQRGHAFVLRMLNTEVADAREPVQKEKIKRGGGKLFQLS